MDLVIYTAATDLSGGFVTSKTDLTAVTDLGTLVFGDSEPLTLKFTTAADGTAPAWLGDNTYSVNVSLGLRGSTGENLFAATNDFTFDTDTYSGHLQLSSADLASWVNARRAGLGYLSLAVSVTTPSNGTETYAEALILVQGAIPAVGSLPDTPVAYATYADALAAQTAAEQAAAAAQTAAQSIPVNLSDSNPEPAGIRTPGVAVTASRSDHVHPGQLDLFFVGGQSNAAGKGDSTSSPTPDATRAFLYDSGGNITSITDPVDDADTGSAWPQFASDYLRLSGRNVGLAVYAVDGSAQTAAADGGSGNWDASGSIYAAALAHYQAAVTAFENAGWIVNVKGLLWLQGEQDAVKIGDATITASDYKAALAAMLVRFRTTFGTDFPMYMVRTGTRTGTSDTPSRELRQAQEEAARADPRLIIATRETVEFPNTSQMADTIHYNQSGLNLVGARLAQAATGNVWRPYAGVKDASSALTGEPGEFVGIGVLAANAVSLTTATVTNVTSITLTAGDWDVEGSATFIPSSATSTVLRAGISTTSATLPTNNYLNAYNGPQWSGASGAAQTLPIVRQRHNLTSTTTVYLVVQPTFTAGTVTAYGQLTARRIR